MKQEFRTVFTSSHPLVNQSLWRPYSLAHLIWLRLLLQQTKALRQKLWLWYKPMSMCRKNERAGIWRAHWQHLLKKLKFFLNTSTPSIYSPISPLLKAKSILMSFIFMCLMYCSIFSLLTHFLGTTASRKPLCPAWLQPTVLHVLMTQGCPACSGWSQACALFCKPCTLCGPSSTQQRWHLVLTCTKSNLHSRS